jgi:8-oxo-dGTP pyrophosphatase MutT (NUDIX family)
VREAATVMLVRDAPDLEVFMLRRNPASVFVGGAYVFPGGAVDPDDWAPRHRVAAVRESFEEAGVLLARSRSTGDVFEPASHRIAELDQHRRRLLAGEVSFREVLGAHEAVADLDALVPFARWVTPPGAPRRFDTWFFVAAAPDGHAYAHDDDEMVASEWVRPADALDRARAGAIELIEPTAFSLIAMADFTSAAAFVGAVRDQWSGADSLHRIHPHLGWQLDLSALTHVSTVEESPCPT